MATKPMSTLERAARDWDLAEQHAQIAERELRPRDMEHSVPVPRAVERAMAHVALANFYLERSK